MAEPHDDRVLVGRFTATEDPRFGWHVNVLHDGEWEDAWTHHDLDRPVMHMVGTYSRDFALEVGLEVARQRGVRVLYLHRWEEEEHPHG